MAIKVPKLLEQISESPSAPVEVLCTFRHYVRFGLPIRWADACRAIDQSQPPLSKQQLKSLRKNLLGGAIRAGNGVNYENHPNILEAGRYAAVAAYVDSKIRNLGDH
jgi:hypothetical protein